VLPSRNRTDLAQGQTCLLFLQITKLDRPNISMKWAWPSWFIADQGTLTLAAQFVRGLIQIGRDARRCFLQAGGRGISADLSFCHRKDDLR